MTVTTFPPRRQADVLAWSRNFEARIAGAPMAFGLDAPQAAAYSALHAAFASAYAAVMDPGANSRAAIVAKNEAREALLSGPGGARDMVRIVQAFPGTTDAVRGELGLKLLDVEAAIIPKPGSAPNLSIISTFARTIKVRLRDQDSPDRRGKPGGVQGATVLYHVGASAPADPSLWTFATNTSKPLFNVEIPASIEAGSRVWLTAFWFNARMASSPPATPKSTRVGDGLARAA